MAPIPYALTIDTEEEWDWSGPFRPDGYGVRNIAGLPELQRLLDACGMRATYFVNHAVIADPEAAATIAALHRHPQVEIGMHCHPWTTPPFTHRQAVPVRESFLENLDPAVATAKLTTTYEALGRHGITPTSYRGGRYSSGRITQQFLQAHRCVVDASICPYTTWPDDGAPDYRQHDLLPRRLAPTRETDRALWQLPLTLGYSRQPFALWRRVRETVAHSPLAALRVNGVLDRLGVVREIWLNFEIESADRMLRMVTLARRHRWPYLCFTLHSSSLHVGGNPYAQTAAQVQRIRASIRAVGDYLARQPDFRPATMTDIAQQLEARHHEDSRH